VCQFQVAAERVGKLHLVRATAMRFEELRRAHEEGNAFGAGRRDVESVEAVEEFHE